MERQLCFSLVAIEVTSKTDLTSKGKKPFVSSLDSTRSGEEEARDDDDEDIVVTMVMV